MFHRAAIQTLRLVFALALVLLLCLQAVAFAAPLPDPNAEPLEAVSLIAKLWKSGAVSVTIIVAAYLVLSYLSKHIEYLKKGKVAVIIAAALGGALTLANSAGEGTTPNLEMIWTAVIGTIALYMSPHQNQPTIVTPTPPSA